MKKYPRIYSLSTIGIIHHQKNDYIFHPYCTDFIGDSDSGKSIIADLLQLIFVGSSVFRSATIPVKARRRNPAVHCRLRRIIQTQRRKPELSLKQIQMAFPRARNPSLNRIIAFQRIRNRRQFRRGGKSLPFGC